MATITGRYAQTWAETTHASGVGSMDDPAFRSVAIQKVLSVTPTTVTLSESGECKIVRKGAARERVKIKFDCAMFGPQVTDALPFIDEQADKERKAQ